MKLDQETIVKHHFWFLVITAAVLTLIGWLIMLVTVPGAADGPRSKIQNAWNLNKKHNKFKNPEFVKYKHTEAESLHNARAKFHTDLYTTQLASTELMTWPEAMIADFDFKNSKYAVEVQVLPTKKTKDLPADDPTRFSGTLVETNQDWCKVIDRKNKESYRFLRTEKTKVAAPDGKSPTFGKLSEHIQKLVTVKYATGKYFGDELTDSEIVSYRDAYTQQLRDVLKTLGPVNFLNQPLVLLHYSKDDGRPTTGFPKPDAKPAAKEDESDLVNGVWVFDELKPKKLPPADNRFFTYVDNWSPRSTEITSDEVWASQENIWIQRELYKQIKAANDSLARCEQVSLDKEGTSGKFRNFYWEIDVKLKGTTVDVKLKNLRPNAQNADGLHFLLRFKDPANKDPSEPVVFPPGNESFSAAGEASFPLTGVSGASLFSVEQVLTTETAAIKRLDVLAIGAAANGDTALSHRDTGKPLKFYKAKSTAAPKQADPKDPKGGADAGKDSQDTPKAVAADTTGKWSKKHHVLLERYLEVTNESRKVPVCMVMIVGPEQVSRVEAALISTPLRFLPTQVLWQRCQLTVAGVSQEAVELTIYGVITLYERPGRAAPVAPQ